MCCGNNGGFGGGCWWIIILILLLCCCCGGAGAFLYVLLVIGASGVLATVGWVWACDLLGLNKEPAELVRRGNPPVVQKLKDLVDGEPLLDGDVCGLPGGGGRAHAGPTPKWMSIWPATLGRMSNTPSMTL